MEVYQSEQEQVEALKKWWDENGKSLIIGVILGLGAIFGWREWQDYKRTQAEAASALYEKMVLAVTTNTEGGEEARQIADEIISVYGSSPYALFARLTLARLAVNASKYEEAEQYLRTALDGKPAPAFEPVIRLRLARVLAARGDYDAARQTLDAGPAGEFAAAYDELRGDISRQTGDIAAARSHYQQAISAASNTGGGTSVLELKLDDLGRAELQ